MPRGLSRAPRVWVSQQAITPMVTPTAMPATGRCPRQLDVAASSWCWGDGTPLVARAGRASPG
jgi:hypothetical protein